MTEKDESAEPAKKRTERTCAGCGKHAPPAELVRVVLDPASGELAVDLAGSGFGRGAHVHPSPVCLGKALKGGFARVFKAKVVGEVDGLGAQIAAGADRRIEGLLGGARRAGQLAIGGDAASAALDEGRASLVIVARDAAAAIKLGAVDRAITEGKAIAFGDKARLGAIMSTVAERRTSAVESEKQTDKDTDTVSGDSPKQVAVIAVVHAGVASAIERTYRMSGPFRRESAGADLSGSKEAWSSPSEVR